jgi:hypothetical protein
MSFMTHEGKFEAYCEVIKRYQAKDQKTPENKAMHQSRQ